VGNWVAFLGQICYFIVVDVWREELLEGAGTEFWLKIEVFWKRKGLLCVRNWFGR